MKVLALDVATHCGWSHTNGQSGCWDFSPKRSDASAAARLQRFRAQLNTTMQEMGVDYVVFENAIVMSGSKSRREGFHVQAEMQGVLKLWCADHSVRFAAFAPKEIKKHATNNGGADKMAMLIAAQRKWRRAFNRHDEADACWLLDYVITQNKIASVS